MKTVAALISILLALVPHFSFASLGSHSLREEGQPKVQLSAAAIEAIEALEEKIGRELTSQEKEQLAISEKQAIEAVATASNSTEETDQSTFFCLGASAALYSGGSGNICVGASGFRTLSMSGTAITFVGINLGAGVLVVNSPKGVSPLGEYDGGRVGATLVGGASGAYLSKTNKNGGWMFLGLVNVGMMILDMTGFEATLQ